MLQHVEEGGPWADLGWILPQHDEENELETTAHRARLNAAVTVERERVDSEGMVRPRAEFNRASCLFALTSVLATTSAQDRIELHIDEAAGVARAAEPVTTGVPCARGTVADVTSLALESADGNPVPASFRAISRWSDGSIRWALLDTQTDIAASGTTTVFVTRGSPTAPETPISIEDGDDTITVSTGPLDFTVGKQRFNLFESLRVGDTELIAGTSPGLVLYPGGDPIVAQRPDLITVEESNPLRAVVLVRGTYPGVHDGLLRYTTRITAWAGRPRVGVRVWLENHGSYGFETPPEWFEFDGQAIELDLGLGAITRYSVDGRPVPGGPLAGRRLEIAQRNRDSTWAGLAASTSVDGKAVSNASRTGGLLSLKSDAGQLAIGLRYFWENYPKTIELDGDRLRVWLWPTDGSWPPVDGKWSERGAGDFQEYRKAGVYHLPGCVRKGHELLLDFSGRHPAATQATLRTPLLALATPEHYARSQAAPGWFAPADFQTGDRRYDGAVDYWNRQAFDAVDRRSQTSIWSARTGRQSTRFDWFGWMNFGDNAWEGGFSSLHYDWPWIMLVNVLRRQRYEFFDMGVTMTRHLIEVDHLWSQRNHPKLQGMARFEYANPFIHGGVDGGRCKPAPTHNWISGVILYYMLTGDPIALECALSSDRGLEARTLSRLREAPSSAGQARETGWGMLCYCSLFDLTGEQEYLDKALVMFRNHQALKWKESGPFTDGGLQYYYSTQGLCELHARTGDPEILRMLEEACARRFSDRHAEWQVFLSNVYAYVGHVKQRPDYIAIAKRLFTSYRPQGSPAAFNGNGAWDKESGKYLRNGHILQHVLFQMR